MSETTETTQKKHTNFFTDENGDLSMRRLLAFLFGLTMIAAIPLNTLNEVDWKMSLVSIGLPLIGSLLMMFFTSWADVANVAKAVKKGE